MSRRVSSLRILHVAPYFEQAWAYGGIPRAVAAIAHGLAARGHRVTISTTDACAPDHRLPRSEGSSPSSVASGWRDRTADGVDVQVFPNASNFLAYRYQFFWPRGFDHFLKIHAREFDIAHLHGCHNVPGALAAKQLARAQVPYVLSPHGTVLRFGKRKLAKRLFDASIGRHVLSRAARVMATTAVERTQVESLGMSVNRVAVVPTPVDLAEFDPPIERTIFRRAHGLGAAPVVMFLGRVESGKRLDLLVRAFADLDRPGARLVVAGNDMGYGRRLQVRLEALGLRSQTICTGLLTGRARLEALADADVIVYASKNEIFGLVPIEALLCGTPVIVADESGCGEVIRRVGGGMVVREGDVSQLTSAIAAILDAPARWRQAAAAAAGQVQRLFGADVVSAQLEAVYREVIES
ncbi:MAG: glycosyltransferase [Vicinamibacterales bacterium]